MLESERVANFHSGQPIFSTEFYNLLTCKPYPVPNEPTSYEMPPERFCPVCEEVKPIEEFVRSRSRDGTPTYGRKCGGCHNEERRESRRTRDAVPELRECEVESFGDTRGSEAEAVHSV